MAAVERSKANDTLIWKHTHRDFGGIIGGARHVLIYRTGRGTMSVPITALSDEEYAEKLHMAQPRITNGFKPYR